MEQRTGLPEGRSVVVGTPQQVMHCSHLIENSHGPCIMAVTPFSYNRPRRAGDLELVGVSAIDAFAEWIDRHAGSISCGEFDDRGPQQPPTPAVNSNIPQYDAFARNQIQFPLHPQLLR